MAQKRNPQDELTYFERMAACNIIWMWEKRKYQELTWYMHNIEAGYIWFNTRPEAPLILSYPAVRQRNLH